MHWDPGESSGIDRPEAKYLWRLGLDAGKHTNKVYVKGSRDVSSLSLWVMLASLHPAVRYTNAGDMAWAMHAMITRASLIYSQSVTHIVAYIYIYIYIL